MFDAKKPLTDEMVRFLTDMAAGRWEFCYASEGGRKGDEDGRGYWYVTFREKRDVLDSEGT